MRTETPMSKKPWSKSTKIIGFLVIIIAPVVLLVVIFSPIVVQKSHQRVVERYMLPSHPSLEDIQTMVESMRGDEEFDFYFYALDQDTVDQSLTNVSQIVSLAENKELLFKALNKLKKQVDALSVLFYNVEYPDGFVVNVDDYPEMKNIMQNFLKKEFQLTLIGVCYKVLYDSQFSFQWSKTAHLSAQKLRSLVFKIKQNKDPQK